MKLFEVRLSHQPEGSKFTENVCVFCLTDSLPRAAELTVKEYPEAKIWSINHRSPFGKQRVIIDPESDNSK